MILNYSAVFTPDEQKGSCSVYFPDIDYECSLDTSNNSNFRKQLQQELAFALWLYEEKGNVIPFPKTICDLPLPQGAYIDFVPCDFDTFKHHISVKNIDL